MAEQEPKDIQAPEEPEKKKRGVFFWPLVGLGVMGGVFLVALVLALVSAIFAEPDDAANWIGIIRDLFIIVLAMEGMLMGIALIVLVIQLAALVNLLQNEIQPIVDNAQQTVSTVKGTAQFMSQNIVEPVVKFGAMAAGVGGIMREMFKLRGSLRSAGRTHDLDKQKE